MSGVRRYTTETLGRLRFIKRAQELGFTLREIVEYLARLLRLRRRIIGLDDRLSRLQATIAEFLPGKPFSRDNYASLKLDSVCEEPSVLMAAFGIAPVPMEDIAPGYIGRASVDGID